MERDSIRISGITAEAVCGCLASERLMPQPVEATAVLYLSLARAGETDDVADTVDYYDAALFCIKIIEESRCLTLERMGRELCDGLLSRYPIVEQAVVTLTKPAAAMPSDSRAEVTVSRRRSNV